MARYLLSVHHFPDLDEALARATEGAAACRGRVEVRPFLPA